MELITNVQAGWRYLMDEVSDPRTRDWPLMSSPFPTMAISLCYAYIVKVSCINRVTLKKSDQLSQVVAPRSGAPV